MATTVRKYKDSILDVATCEDWELIVAVGHFSHSLRDLTKKVNEALYRVLWAHSDGYGEPGYIPPQGYDWSGIRDSSPEAKKAMAKAIRGFLGALSMSRIVVREQLI